MSDILKNWQNSQRSEDNPAGAANLTEREMGKVKGGVTSEHHCTMRGLSICICS